MKRKTRGEWQAVLRSDVWSKDGLPEDVHRALYLSYHDLSSPLKQCFIFCSLFCEDFNFERTDLIYMWLAEGFLHGKRDFWELGNEYYTELLMRNLLEDYSYYNREQCKMHDLLWSFARHLGNDENCVLREGSDANIEASLKIRRLSIEGDEVNTGVIKKEKGLRTLLLRDKPEIALDDMCKALSNLRILDLSGSNFSRLPDTLCDLVHLRYLNVSSSDIRNLPNSIGNLKHLVYLNLAYCKDLKHVPCSMINLQELKYLNTYDSGVKTIPEGLNKLDKLVGLYGFKPYQNNLEGFSSLDELETLSKLVILQLQCLEEVSDMNIAKRVKLWSKDLLRHLYLEYTFLSSEEQLSQTNKKKMTSEDVLNEFCPPHSLEFVAIENYFGNHLPNWLNLVVDLPTLRVLHIENCACFQELASLGQLPNLEYLHIIWAYSVVNVGEEFLSRGIQSRDTIATSCHAKPAFPKLSLLYFAGMPNWKEWQWNKGQSAMPNLKKLYIEACPQLRSLPEGLLHHATSLEYLTIMGADNLITVENLPSIKDIRICGNPNLVRISNLPGISYIKIHSCPNLKALEKLKVQTMALTDYKMKTLPEYLTLSMPQKLEIRCSEELLLKIASQRESGSEWNRLKHIPKVKICTKYESFYVTYQKKPFSFTTNISKRSVSKMMW